MYELDLDSLIYLHHITVSIFLYLTSSYANLKKITYILICYL